MRPFSILLISAVGLAIYSNTFHCPFHFDDFLYIINNPTIKNLHDPLSIWKFYPCRFFTFLSLALNYHFNGLNVFGYHVVNVGVHLISAVLVWWLTLLTFSTPAFQENPVKSKPSLPLKKEPIVSHANLIALFAGLIFVSHPLQTEAVTYIWQRTASMAAMFYMASLCFYVKARLCMVESGPKQGRTNFGGFYYTCSLIVALMAMFTKEMTATLPVMIWLYEFTFLKTKKSLNWKYVLPFFFVLLMVALTVALLPQSIKDQEMEGVLTGGHFFTPTHYLLIQFRVMVTYIRLVFLPLNQNLDYDYPIYNSFFDLPVLLSLLFIIAILILAKRLFQRYRIISFSIFWFFLTLLPESSVMPLRDVIFEHRLYLPLVGYGIFLVSGAYYLFGKNNLTAMIVALTVVVACNSVLTYQRNKVWKDDITLWGDVIRKSPHKSRAYNNCGKSYLDQGHLAQALEDFDKSIEMDPKNAQAYNNRGIIFEQQDNFTRAMSDFDSSIAVDPMYTEAYINRGILYSKQNDLSSAISDFTKAIEINPGYAQAYNSRADAYKKHGDFTEALLDVNKAVELNPGYKEAYNDRGEIYEKMGDTTQALAAFNRQIEMNPSDAQAYYNRGLIFEKQGNFTQAISDYSKAIEIDPKYAGAYNNRGLIFEQQNALVEAMTDYSRAIAIDPENAQAYNNRGNVENKQGDLIRAISDYGKAIELDPKYAGAYYNRGSILGRHGHLNQAIADLTKAIEFQPDYAEAFDNRGVAYFMLKEYPQAWADTQKAQALGAAVNPGFIHALKQALGQDN